MYEKLTEEGIAAELKQLSGWQREGESIARTFKFPTFKASIAFVGRIAPLADAADHHPDMDIRFDRVRVALTTHFVHGLTRHDTALARLIDATAV